ncbi:B-cell receptor CD22-like isoform X2 [Channa argus]|uniref:B-cell receptor CD22-like isoform X2 n=1 Tax=Channa argus TaxID=215402 RepID=UPI0029450641|nr:hypothetical protein Q8A73_003029 [Channa argus]
MFPETGCIFMGFILYMSGVYGQYGPGVNSICALKGLSVDLPCSRKLTSNPKWYIRHSNDDYVWKELYADGENTLYNLTEESNFTLRINNLSESDTKFYCCKENTDDDFYCKSKRTELYVTDLQVKVIPTTENQTVTLMCSTSCALTETPAAYIWYKNREFLYEDWSPWYQELVHSEEGVTYSCAIKGYEDLRAPDVSVDSVSSTCFTVTYAKGRMCSYQQKSEDESCSITYPTEVYVVETPIGTSLKLSCNSSCLMVDPQTAYRWHWNKELLTVCEKQDIISFDTHSETVSCAVKGHEDLFSDEICTDNNSCWTVNYPSRRICALEGSSVNISSNYYVNGQNTRTKKWHKIKRHGEVTDGGLTEDDNRVEKYDNMKDEHTLTIHELKKSDSGEYAFVFNNFEVWKPFHVPGVILLVTGLKVTMAPSAEVTEGQRVTLTCSTSCPLTDNNIYIWYLNGRRLTLPESPNKHLILDPVGFQHAGNYSCVVPTPQNISSSEENLTVNARDKSVLIMNAVRLTLLSFLLPGAPLILCLWMRKKKSLTSTVVRTGQMEMLYETIALPPKDPEAKAGPAGQQENTTGRAKM